MDKIVKTGGAYKTSFAFSLKKKIFNNRARNLLRVVIRNSNNYERLECIV